MADACVPRFHDDPRPRTHRLPSPAPPPLHAGGFARVAEPPACDDPHRRSIERTARPAGLLSDTHRARPGELQAAGCDAYRCAWEMRADDAAGCLRTPRGGSSRQGVIHIRARMRAGVSDTGRLMGSGDAVRVPAAWVARHTIRIEGKDE